MAFTKVTQDNATATQVAAETPEAKPTVVEKKPAKVAKETKPDHVKEAAEAAAKNTVNAFREKLATMSQPGKFDPSADKTVYTESTFVIGENGRYPNGCFLPYVECPSDSKFAHNYNACVRKTQLVHVRDDRREWYGSSEKNIVSVIEELNAALAKAKSDSHNFCQHSMAEREPAVKFIADVLRDKLDGKTLTSWARGVYGNFLFSAIQMDPSKDINNLRDYYYANSHVFEAILNCHKKGKLPADVVEFLVGGVVSNAPYHFASRVLSNVEEEQDFVVELELANTFNKFKLGLRGINNLRNYITRVTIFNTVGSGLLPRLFGYDHTTSNQYGDFERSAVSCFAYLQNNISASSEGLFKPRTDYSNLSDILSYKAIAEYSDRLELLHSMYCLRNEIAGDQCRPFQFKTSVREQKYKRIFVTVNPNQYGYGF